MSADLPTDFEAVEHAQAWLDYWRPRVGVPVITRIRHVASLLRDWRKAWDRYPDERGEDDWTAPLMARAGLVEPDPDPVVVAARVAAKWPALWAKYRAPVLAPSP